MKTGRIELETRPQELGQFTFYNLWVLPTRLPGAESCAAISRPLLQAEFKPTASSSRGFFAGLRRQADKILQKEWACITRLHALCSSTTRIFVPFISGSETLRPKPEVSRDAFVEGVEIRKHYATVTHTTIHPENCPVPICQIWQVTAGPCRAIKTWQELELNLRYLRVGLRRQLGRLAIRILIDVLLDL